MTSKPRRPGPPPGVEITPPSQALKQKVGGSLQPLSVLKKRSVERRLESAAQTIEPEVAEAAETLNTLAQKTPPDFDAIRAIAHELRGLAATCGHAPLGIISDCIWDVVEVSRETDADPQAIIATMTAAAHLSVKTPDDQAAEAAELCRAMAHKWLTSGR